MKCEMFLLLVDLGELWPLNNIFTQLKFDEKNLNTPKKKKKTTTNRHNNIFFKNI